MLQTQKICSELMRKLIRLVVNGEEHDLQLEANRLLLQALRDDIGLTGTKEGCSIGVCGACSVIIDGRVVSSCLTLAVACQGKTDRNHRRARKGWQAPSITASVY